VIARQKLLHLGLRQHRRQELRRDVAFQQPVAVASSQEPSEERLFRINDEMQSEQGEDRSGRTEQVLNDGKRRDE
jgi:hypothetical protein